MSSYFTLFLVFNSNKQLKYLYSPNLLYLIKPKMKIEDVLRCLEETSIRSLEKPEGFK